jgi:hypothetical protein
MRCPVLQPDHEGAEHGAAIVTDTAGGEREEDADRGARGRHCCKQISPFAAPSVLTKF